MCAESHTLGMRIISVYVIDYVLNSVCILSRIWKRSLINLPSLILVQTCRDGWVAGDGDHDHGDGAIRARSKLASS